MTSQGLNLYTPGDAFKPPYAARVAEFIAAGETAGLAPWSEDTLSVALVLVDIQHDFVDPAGSLAVPGAQADVARLLRWLYANAGSISRIYASLDTHLPGSIFYRAWWVSPTTGEHPAPFTAISLEDVRQGVWAPVDERQRAWATEYLTLLRAQAKKDLMIWPEHTMQGTLGHMLTPALSEAIAWHSAARQSTPAYIVKGQTPHTEYYGIFGAEVPDPRDPPSAMNDALLDQVMGYDRVYVAGEAKSHCVLETLRQIVARYRDEPAMLGRVYALTDCMSAVAHPTIDFDALAEEAFAEMRGLGVNFVTSASVIALSRR